MEKMKMSVGTMATLVFVAVAVSALLISFEMAQAKGDKVKASFELELEQNESDVDVEVKAKGLATGVVFTVRAYSSPDCMGSLIEVIGTDNSGGSGKISIKGTITEAVFDSKTLNNEVDSVESVSIRSPGTPGDLVQCFLNTTP